MQRRVWCLVSALVVVLAGAGNASAGDETVILATTTTTQDSGLIDVLLPAFESATGIRVKMVAMGTREALATGRRGDADVVLAHSRKAEDRFMADGFGLVRYDVMHNDFVLVGPAGDPANAEGLEPDVAFTRIAASRSRFISRGDGSGTYEKEQEIWQKAGVAPRGDWFISTGQGQGESARVASEKQAYMLIDRGTYLALKATLALRIITEGRDELRNPYGVIVVNPAKNPRVHVKAAKAFAEWLISPAAQKLIGDFGRTRFGRSLFVPDAVR
jgi:tungstate transport system substrate-binding protein